MKQVHKFNTLPDDLQQTVAAFVAIHTNDHEQTVSVTSEDVQQKYAGWVALDSEQCIGYVGATEPRFYRGNMLTKVGSLVVAEQHQGNGIASQLIEAATTELAHKSLRPFAFCNEQSLPRFLQQNYVLTGSEDLPRWAISTLGNQGVVLAASVMPHFGKWI